MSNEQQYWQQQAQQAPCKLSPRCEATSDERSAGNLHATFCGSRGAGNRPRPPGGYHQAVSLPRSVTKRRLQRWRPAIS